MNNVLKEIQARFIHALSAKNSWGKNEIELLYLKISSEVMSDYIDSHNF